MSILVVAEHNNQELNSATLNAISAATQLGDTIDLVIAGKDCQKVAEQASRLPRCSHGRPPDGPDEQAGTDEG